MSVDIKTASKSLERLAILKFFPSDDTARTEILAIACRMAVNNGQIEWLARRCVSLWNSWEGPREMRAVFCSKYKPLDGIDIASDLPQFIDGIPSESEDRNRALIAGAGEVKRLPPGPVAKLIHDARTTTTAPRPRDKVDEISEYAERTKSVSRAPVPTEAEIQALKELQDRNRKES